MVLIIVKIILTSLKKRPNAGCQMSIALKTEPAGRMSNIKESY